MLGLSLRQFSENIGVDPGNWSKVERGALPPPDSSDQLQICATALGLVPGSREVAEFVDLAAAERGRIPWDLLANPALMRTLPKFFQSLRYEKPLFEEDAKDRFLAHLREERSDHYITTDVNVRVSSQSNRDFDFELT